MAVFKVGIDIWVIQLLGWSPNRTMTSFRLHPNLLTYAAIVGATHALEYYRRYRERELRASRLETELVQAQLQALKMPPDDENLAPFQWEADLHRDLKLRELYAKMSVTTQETIGGGSAWVLEAESRRGQSEKLYFDSQSGLLLRRLQIRESPLGPVPLQMDFGDYREVDGVRIPFFSRWARPDVTLIFQYDEVRHNLPVEDARFEKP